MTERELLISTLKGSLRTAARYLAGGFSASVGAVLIYHGVIEGPISIEWISGEVSSKGAVGLLAITSAGCGVIIFFLLLKARRALFRLEFELGEEWKA